MNWINAGFLSAGACIAIASDAAGAIMYILQERAVATPAFVAGQPEGGSPIQSQDFGEFNRTKTHNYSQNRGTATATQLSRLLPESILMNGSASVTGIGFVVEGEAWSRFDVTFRLSEATAFLIDHSQTSSSSGNGPTRSAVARLSGPSGAIFSWAEDFNVPNSWPASPFGGLLQAGQYTLQIEARVYRGTQISGSGTNEASVAFAFSIPTPITAAFLGLAGMATAARRTRRSG